MRSNYVLPAIAGFVLALVLIVPFACTPGPIIPPTPGPAPAPLSIRGFVIAAIPLEPATSQKKIQEVYLPAARVFLRRQNGNAVVTSDVTDLSGRYTLRVDAPGTYRICAEAEGFTDNCQEKELSLRSQSVYAGNLSLAPKRGDGIATAFGSVSLRDGKRARMLQLMMGRNDFARVDFEDASRNRYTAYVNNYGEYVIPRVPVDRDFMLRARIENGLLEQKVDRRTGLQTGSGYRFDLRFDNAAPKLAPMIPIGAAGKRVEFAAPGQSVTLEARAEDADGDNLEYVWMITPGNGTLSADDQRSVKWTLPTTSGRYAVTLAVSDRKGGYEETYFTLPVSSGGVPFSGHVVDPGGGAVPGARVEINGRTITANPEGWFKTEVPPADKYVVNVRRTGFALASTVHPEGITGGTWNLRRVQTQTVDPTNPITIQHRRTKEDCPGPRSRQITWSDFDQPGLIQWQNGKGDAVSLAEIGTTKRSEAEGVLNLLAYVNPTLAQFGAREMRAERRRFQATDRPCGPGIAVEIPANALVDRNGNAPSGMIDIAVGTVDLDSPGQMPGDFSSVDLNGNPKVMESYGAGNVDISSGTTDFGRLRDGMTAKVRIPVDPGQLASGVALEPTIPLLYYDASAGVWKEEGILTLDGTGAGRAYVADVKHFSPLNADLQKSGQSCVAVHPGPGLTVPYDVEVVLPPWTPGGVPQIRTLEMDSPNEQVIYNLPNNTNIVLTPIISGPRPDGSVGNIPAGVFVVNTGGAQTATSNLPPGPPYYNTNSSGDPIGPCMTRVDLTNLQLQEEPDLPNQFLQGLDLQSTNLTELQATDPAIATAVLGASEDYYDLVDPLEARRDLIDFKSKNEFGTAIDAAQGELEVSAFYANSGDLGFGRAMFCRRNRAADGQFDMACYVTNYGDQNTPDADDAANAALQNAAAEVATVAMEYSRVEDAGGGFPDNNRTVKFFVYKKGKASLVNPGQPNGIDVSANLDGFGERPVPQLCMVCHGGVYATVPADPANPGGQQMPAFDLRSDAFMNSRFLPFDLHFFTSPPAPNDLTAQQPQFRTLNLEIVKLVPGGAPASDPVVELITALYPGSPPAALQNPNAVVPNWDAGNPASVDHRFYLDVFAKACRTCHITSPFNNVVMNDKNDFHALIPQVQTRVCNQHVMPHARRTHDLFWLSLGPNMAAFLQEYGQALAGWDTISPDSQCGLDFTPGGNVTISTYDAKIQPIFTAGCSCHGTAAAFNANLALSAGNSYSNLFTGSSPIESVEHPPTPRIDPTSSANSYLYRKVEGNHLGLGNPFVSPGPGVQMPQGCDPNCAGGGDCLSCLNTDGIDDNDLEEIRKWIDVLGAPGS